MKYKIGEVSKLLNIPIETIRFYEKKNIINPSKEKDNNYRSYESWDINFLIDCKKYRSYGFSLAEVEEIIHKGTLNDYIDKIDDRQSYIDNKLKYYSLLSEKNKEYKKSLINIRENINKCSLLYQPEIYYFIHRHNDSFDKTNGIVNLVKTWIEYTPFVEFMLEIPIETVEKKEEIYEYRWGFSIRKEYLEAFNLPLNEYVKHVEIKQCIYTVICIKEKDTFYIGLLNSAMEYIEKNNLRVCGNVRGNLLSRVHEPEGFLRYIEVWIPVEKINI